MEKTAAAESTCVSAHLSEATLGEDGVDRGRKVEKARIVRGVKECYFQTERG